MTVNNHDLGIRSNEFGTLLNNTRCTNLHGERENTEESIEHLAKLLMNTHAAGGTIYVIGNGGSAAVASHAVTDFVNACHLRAFTLHESSLMTCMANDFGYVDSFKLMLKTVFKKNDVLIAISSSGKSSNMHHSVELAKSMGGTAITLSGFQPDNQLSKMGFLNFWLDSSNYGFVEIGHLFILHNLADRMAAGIYKGKKIEYDTEEVAQVVA
jgi:D-sedoheptulose 7-phosphate isomerase